VTPQNSVKSSGINHGTEAKAQNSEQNSATSSGINHGTEAKAQNSEQNSGGRAEFCDIVGDPAQQGEKIQNS
jgi:hypothetical protein